MSTVQDEEIWKNANQGRTHVLKYDHEGRLKLTPVRGGQQVALSSLERKINQERAASADQDSFSNGTLIPVMLVESAEDYQEIASNPNLLSEEDMVNMFKLTIGKFRARLGEITNKIVLARLAELANQADDTSLKVTMGQVKAIKARRVELLEGSLGLSEDVEASDGVVGKKAFTLDSSLDGF